MKPEGEILIFVPKGAEIRYRDDLAGFTAAQQLLAQPFKEGMKIKTTSGEDFSLTPETRRFDAAKGGWVPITTPWAFQAFA